MKLMFPLLISPIEISDECINVLTIENKKAFYQFVTELYNQSNKDPGNIVLSLNDTSLDISKSVEMIYQLIPFDSNKKSLLTKLYSYLKNEVVTENYEYVCKVKSEIERFVLMLTDLTDSSLTYDEPDVASIMKTVNLRFDDSSDSLCEILIEFFINVSSLEKNKLFVVVNLREFVSEEEYILFKKTVIDHKFKVLLVGSTYYDKAADERLTVIDNDLCVI